MHMHMHSRMTYARIYPILENTRIRTTPNSDHIQYYALQSFNQEHEV